MFVRCVKPGFAKMRRRDRIEFVSIELTEPKSFVHCRHHPNHAVEQTIRVLKTLCPKGLLGRRHLDWSVVFRSG